MSVKSPDQEPVSAQSLPMQGDRRSLVRAFAASPGGHHLPPCKDESGRTVAIYVGVAMLVTLVGLSLGQVVLDDVDEAPEAVAAGR